MKWKAKVLREKFTKITLLDFCEITGYDYEEIMDSDDDVLYEMSDAEFRRWKDT